MLFFMFEEGFLLGWIQAQEFEETWSRPHQGKGSRGHLRQERGQEIIALEQSEEESLWEELRSMVELDEAEEATNAKRREERKQAEGARSGSGSGSSRRLEAFDGQLDEALALTISERSQVSDQLQIHSASSYPASCKAELLGRALVRMGMMRDQNRRMAGLLRRLERESGLLARMDSLHRENTALHTKYTAMQV